MSKKLRRLVGDAIRLWREKSDLSDETFGSRRDRLHKRLAELIVTEWNDSHARRLLKRLRRHRDDLLTFLDRPNVPFDNNHAERSIRPAVIIRKKNYGNRSDPRADCQSVLMSVFRTLKQRNHDPILTVIDALTNYIATGNLPPLPKPASDD